MKEDNRKIMVDLDLLYDIGDSLNSMINYADDGLLNEYDEDFKDFFDEVKNARNNNKKLYKVIEKSLENMRKEKLKGE